MNEQYLVAYTVNYKGFTDTEPFIYDDFASTKAGCCDAVKKLKGEGYTQVTPFIREKTEHEVESYSWKYVKEHKCIM